METTSPLTSPPTVADAEDTHTIGHKSARGPRVAFITRGERRRVWTPEQKREIVAESLGADLTRRADQAAVARRYWPLPADEAMGARTVYLALDDHDRADCLVSTPTGGPARRLRLACAGAPPQAGTGRVITPDSFPATRWRRRSCVRGHQPRLTAGRPRHVAAPAARGGRRGRVEAHGLAERRAGARCRNRQAARRS